MERMMDFSVAKYEQVTVVSVVGSIDALTAGEVTEFLSQQVSQGEINLVVDLAKVDYVSSAGLRTILATLKEARLRGGDVRLAGAQPNVYKVLQMSGFTNILKSFDDSVAAVASFQSPRN
jgi:anti-anti-sigma factor